MHLPATSHNVIHPLVSVLCGHHFSYQTCCRHVSAKARLILLFRISHIYSICMQAGSHYSLLTNAMYTQQMYGATAVKSGCVIAQKAIMTVEAAGFDRGSGH